MLENNDIIYFSNDWNADNKTSGHHIADQLKKNNRLFYIEASGLRAPSASTHDLGRIFSKIAAFVKGPRKVEDNVHVFSPLILPFHKFAFVKRINKRLLIHALRAMCRKFGIQKPILWIVIPHMSAVVGKLNEKLVVYYCVDDFSSLPGVLAGPVREYDRYLTKRADLVFTPSIPLYEKKKALNKNVHLSPHGVDIAHFEKVFDPDLPVPEDAKNIKHPVIGFFGLIEKWIDLDLIKFIAVKRPDFSILLIGRVVQDIAMFANVPNVHFLGARPFADLPRYAKLFDVAIIPYVLNDQVFNANPIKLREYLAMGKPVVSVRNPEIEKFSDVVRISDDYEGFLNNIIAALDENDPKSVEKRRAAVKDSSWDQRFKAISKIVESKLQER
jgi:glycosyltransferase involved in cell wall biosynthesis